MDTQKTKEQDAQTVDPEKDTNEEEVVEGGEGGAEVEASEEEEAPEEWQQKFNKQSSAAQKKITEANEKLFTAHKKIANTDPNHILELSKGDDKDVKMAKHLSKELYDLSLDRVLKSLQPDEETKEELEQRLRKEIERESNKNASYTFFTKSNSILDENSSDYNENIKKVFDERVERLMGNEILTIEETNQILDDAFYLSNRGGKDPEKAQASIASAGSGGMVSNVKPMPSKAFREIDEELMAAGFSPLSDEAKKLMKQGKL